MYDFKFQLQGLDTAHQYSTLKHFIIVVTVVVLPHKITTVQWTFLRTL